MMIHQHTPKHTSPPKHVHPQNMLALQDMYTPKTCRTCTPPKHAISPGHVHTNLSLGSVGEGGAGHELPLLVSIDH